MIVLKTDMKKVGFAYDDVFLSHKTPDWHPESGQRLLSIMSALKDSPVKDRMSFFKPRKASFEEISAVHTPRYVELIRNFQPGYADPDTYISSGSLDAALYAAGALLEAVERIRAGEIQRAFCAVRPPGHHAEADTARGFCIFNNIAVSARYAQKNGFSKIFIVDFDVHHGNGTQHIFEEDDTVFYFSTHQYPHYPGTGGQSEKGKNKGKNFTLNIPMRAGSGDEEYRAVYGGLLPEVIKTFGPDMILVSAGYDMLTNDPLSGLRVTPEGVREIVKGTLSCGDVPSIFSLEGGYDLTGLARCVLITLDEMLDGG